MLRSGECETALAGAVNILLDHERFKNFGAAKMLSPDGRCYTFDDRANGYVRSEGCGVVILKRLDDAIRDGDRIRAVIRGSAVNQDGKSNGLTAPNGPAQQDVIQRAMLQASVEPQEIDYIEANGTGTALGDPIEVGALAAVFSGDRATPLLLGSVKTNIGHTEAAAGIANLIKVILALEHEMIPQTLHFTRANPNMIPLESIPARVVSENVEWKRSDDHCRMAGISSFGFSGTNAHMIVEEAPKTQRRASNRTGEKEGRVLGEQ